MTLENKCIEMATATTGRHDGNIDAPSVSVVSPVYGCSGCLEELVERISMSLEKMPRTFEILLVDDGSPDDAWARISEISRLRPAVRGLRLSRNFGQHAAISAGLHHARGDVVIVMDCDLQDIPEEIPSLLTALTGEIDIVLAQRMQRQDNLLKRFSSQAFYRLLGWLTESEFDASTANFGAYNKKVIDTLNKMPESDRFLPLLIHWTGFQVVKVPVTHGMRMLGKSGYSLKQLIRLALNVALSFSDKPLRMVIKTGLVFAGIAILIAAISVYLYVVGDIRVAGFTSIIGSIWLMGSAIMSCLGIVGLYLGRLYNQAKGRPHFLITDILPGGNS